jgi:cell division protein FtsB
MASSRSSDTPRPRPYRPLILTVVVLAALWFLFFDSHSLTKRVRWHQEYARLAAENEALRHEIEVLEERLKEPLSDEVIEKIAREEYGMRRPDETVYRVEQQP